MIDPIPIVGRVRARLTDHYVFPEVAAEIADRLAARAADYPTDLPALAAAVTADLQSVNGDQHLRLVHHVEPFLVFMLPDLNCRHGLTLSPRRGRQGLFSA